MAESAAPTPAAPAAPKERPMTRAEAQRKLGLFAPHDYVTMGLVVFSWMTLGFWAFFGDPTLLNVLGIVIFNVVLMQIWLVILVYRVLVFVLDMQADVNLMPETAARIAVGYIRLGGNAASGG